MEEFLKVFLSWAAPKSNKIAKVLDQWLTEVVTGVTTFYSPRDIPPGSWWRDVLSSELSFTNFGIFLITRENLRSEWMGFEAGALSKNKDSVVFTILFDVGPKEIIQPLQSFQPCEFSKRDLLGLVLMINERCSNESEEQIVAKFEASWPDLEEKVGKIMAGADYHYSNYPLLFNAIDNESIRGRSLKKWMVDSILLKTLTDKVSNLYGGRLSLKAFGTRDYIAYQYLLLIMNLLPGDSYIAVSTMGFFSHNKISGGIRNYFNVCRQACSRGASIRRVIVADLKQTEGKDDYERLMKEIDRSDQLLADRKKAGKWLNKVHMVKDYDEYEKTLRDRPGFGLIKRDDEYILIQPEKIKEEGENPKIDIYFSDGKDKIYLEKIAGCIAYFEELSEVQYEEILK